MVITLAELADCKTCDDLIDLIYQATYADVWDADDLWVKDEEQPIAPEQSRADKDVCTALMREAIEYAERGDLEEAKLRVRNRFYPKFNSLRECEAQYKEAMSRESG